MKAMKLTINKIDTAAFTDVINTAIYETRIEGGCIKEIMYYAEISLLYDFSKAHESHKTDKERNDEGISQET